MSRSESIFISYRRSDSEDATGRICDRLKTRFGRDHVFMDTGSIELGENFEVRLHEAISASVVVLVMIGEKWLTVAEEDGSRRLDKPGDFVRKEVEAALSRGVHVIPVLLGTARMPSSDQLPKAIEELSKKNAISVEAGRRFDSDIAELIKGIEKKLGLPDVDPSSSEGRDISKESIPPDTSSTDDLEQKKVLEKGNAPMRHLQNKESLGDKNKQPNSSSASPKKTGALFVITIVAVIAVSPLAFFVFQRIKPPDLSKPIFYSDSREQSSDDKEKILEQKQWYVLDNGKYKEKGNTTTEFSVEKKKATVEFEERNIAGTILVKEDRSETKIFVPDENPSFNRLLLWKSQENKWSDNWAGWDNTSKDYITLKMYITYCSSRSNRELKLCQ